MSKVAKVLNWLEKNDLNSVESESLEDSESNDCSADESALGAFEIVEVGPKTEELIKEKSLNKTKEKSKEKVNISQKYKIKKIPPSHCVDIGIILMKLQELHNKWNENNKDKNIKVWNFGTKEPTFSSHGPYMDDILLFCLIYNYRGTSFYNIVQISTGELKEVIEHLGIKYEIAKPKRKEWYSTESLTLERIVRAYPDICCDLYSIGKYKNILSDDVLGEEITDSQRALLCPLFPSVACNILLQQSTNVLPQLLWLAYKYDEKITKNLFDLRALWRYLVQSLLIHLIPEQVKISLCKKWKLVIVYDQPAAILLRTRLKCMNFLETVFADHKDWPKVKYHMNNYAKDPLTSFYCDKYLCLRDDLTKNLLNNEDKPKIKSKQNKQVKKKTIKNKNLT